jgi:hypothetical protein
MACARRGGASGSVALGTYKDVPTSCDGCGCNLRGNNNKCAPCRDKDLYILKVTPTEPPRSIFSYMIRDSKKTIVQQGRYYLGDTVLMNHGYPAGKYTMTASAGGHNTIVNTVDKLKMSDSITWQINWKDDTIG